MATLMQNRLFSKPHLFTLGQNEKYTETLDQKYFDLIKVYIDIRTCKIIETWKHKDHRMLSISNSQTHEIFYVLK